MNQVSPPSLSVLEELNSIREFVQESQRQIKAGMMPDMTSLEQRTADLCRIIREAGSDVQQKCAPELKELARQLDNCEQNLRSFYDSVVAPAVSKQ